MKKKIFGSMAILAIAAVVAFNVNLGTKKSDRLSLLALTNIEVLADGEDGGERKYQCKIESTCEDIYYYHVYDDVCQEVTATEHIIDCIGTGSVSCTPSFDVTYEYGDYVSCSTCNGPIAG
ncbi:hypothetical protein SDC9_117312 [bioreactor metagenome]|uniref:Uncharacterized protein n=1 Tax=bioreactor metagenome TaxID=1076179 RepID=A0A645BYX3_9ZZZZ|nr:NVEALA domain-containing protein [Paludibacter sp.]